MPAAVETINLTKRFTAPKRYREILLHPFRRTESTVLENIDLQIKPGELFGLLGPNGAGKTTLVKILCNMILPTEGQALIFGNDVTDNENKIRKMIGYVVSEERSFFWRLSGRQNLKFFSALNNLTSHRADRRITEVVSMVGLTADIDKSFRTYSTGMKQKLAIARGLLTNPKILFLDEPTRALDPIAASRVRDFIKNVIVGQEQKTVVLATNSMTEAETMCDRIAVIDKGRLITCASLQTLKTQLNDFSRYVLRFKDPVSSVTQKLSSISRHRTHLQFSTTGSIDGDTYATLEFTNTFEEPYDVIKRLMAEGLKVKAFYPEEYSLDEVFTKIIA